MTGMVKAMGGGIIALVCGFGGGVSKEDALQTQTQNSGSNSTSRGNRNSLFCQFCNIPGHDTKDCRKLARFLQENNITISSALPPTPMVEWCRSSCREERREGFDLDGTMIDKVDWACRQGSLVVVRLSRRHIGQDRDQ